MDSYIEADRLAVGDEILRHGIRATVKAIRRHRPDYLAMDLDGWFGGSTAYIKAHKGRFPRYLRLSERSADD